MEGIGSQGIILDEATADCLFAVIVQSKEALYQSGEVCTKEGEEFWLTLEDGYNSSTGFHGYNEVPEEIQVFKTHAEAVDFAKKWTGHPWWVNPKGYEIVCVKPRMVTVQDGYTVCSIDAEKATTGVG